MEHQLAARYAEALFSVASERSETDRVETDLVVVAQLLADLPEAVRVLDHPEISLRRKHGVLERAFSTAVSPTTYAFLKLLVRRGRGHLAATIRDEYEQLANRARGVEKVEVWTAVPMTPEQRLRLDQTLQRTLGKRIELEAMVDASVLAGVRLRIGDRLVDGSAAGRLAALRSNLREIGTVE